MASRGLTVDEAATSFRVTMLTTVAGPQKVVTTPLAGRRRLIIRVEDATNSVRVSYAGASTGAVSTTFGELIKAGEVQTFNLAECDVWVCPVAGTPIISIREEAA